MGDEFCKIGVREPQKAANEAFCEFGEYHRYIFSWMSLCRNNGKEMYSRGVMTKFHSILREQLFISGVSLKCKNSFFAFIKPGVSVLWRNNANLIILSFFRQMEKFGISMLKQTKPILSDLGTYLTKVDRFPNKPILLVSWLLKSSLFSSRKYIFFFSQRGVEGWNPRPVKSRI